MDAVVDPTALPVAHCTTCDREALCHLDLDECDGQIVRCIGCATLVPTGAVRWLTLAELETVGYGLVLPEGGCGRPDCGGGRCGRSAPEDEA